MDLIELRKKYDKIMENFTPTGKEPEGKERLRHLLHNQRISVRSLPPYPTDWNAWTADCIKNEDWPGLCRVINQRSKGDMLPVIYGGYNYETHFHCMLECFACGNIQAMERILPPELAQVKNYNYPFFPVAAHMLIGLWYKDKSVLEWAVPNAERFLAGKKANLLEKSMIAFLLDLTRGDTAKAGEDLSNVCKGYPRDQRYVLGTRPFCTLAHGLYCLAQIILPEGDFQAIKMPKHKNFLPKFALWRRENPEPDLPLWFRYPEDMPLLNAIYDAPPAKLVLCPPAPDDKEQKWYAHDVKWVDNYVNEIWEIGVL